MESPRAVELDEARGTLAQSYALTQQVIYRGLASAIFLAVERGSLLQVGVKVIMKAGLDTEQELAQALSEMKLHAAIPPHPNIIRLLAAEETPKAIILVTPYTPHGDLWQLICFGKTYCETEVRNCAGQIFAALGHLHAACGLIHGDIKPQNFLLFQVDGRHSVQLCDMGLAERPDHPGGTVAFHGLRGTSGWFSPEMLANQDYGQAIDLFSVGLILFRMLGGYAPFDPPSRFTEPAEFDDRYWCHVTPACRRLLAQLLCFEPAERRTAPDVCRHEWFAEPTLAEPTEEQLAALRRFGPPPDTTTLFWPPVKVPGQERSRSYANLQDLVVEMEDGMEAMDIDGD
mmetsp:Transcript_119979/g.373670  ORF Transcript_119979/g.373670 Transcript_119979/m.373670 type:complete len:344 (-) Transcript_119979:12-1043(-)